MTFRGLDKRVSSVVAELKSLGMVRNGRLDSVPEVCYLDTSCSSDPLRRARSRFTNDLSVCMATKEKRPNSTLPPGPQKSS